MRFIKILPWIFRITLKLRIWITSNTQYNELVKWFLILAPRPSSLPFLKKSVSWQEFSLPFLDNIHLGKTSYNLRILSCHLNVHCQEHQDGVRNYIPLAHQIGIAARMRRIFSDAILAFPSDPRSKYVILNSFFVSWENNIVQKLMEKFLCKSIALSTIQKRNNSKLLEDVIFTNISRLLQLKLRWKMIWNRKGAPSQCYGRH